MPLIIDNLPEAVRATRALRAALPKRAVFGEVEGEIRRQVADRATARRDAMIPVLDYSSVVSGDVDPATILGISARGAPRARRFRPAGERLERRNHRMSRARKRPSTPNFRTSRGRQVFRQPVVEQAADLRHLLVEAANSRPSVGTTDEHTSVPESPVDVGKRRQAAFRSRAGACLRGPHSSSDASVPSRRVCRRTWMAARSSAGSTGTFQQVYRHVLAGNWRDYDPFDAAYRPDVQEIPSPAVCSMFPHISRAGLHLRRKAPATARCN